MDTSVCSCDIYVLMFLCVCVFSKVCEDQPALLSSPFNSLNLSLPNGLLLQFLREDTQGRWSTFLACIYTHSFMCVCVLTSVVCTFYLLTRCGRRKSTKHSICRQEEACVKWTCVFVCPGVSSQEQGVLVKQSFPLGPLQDPSLSKELSRIVTSEGAVIRHMRNGSAEVNVYAHIQRQTNMPLICYISCSGRAETSSQITCSPQVLFADGSVSFSPDSGPVWVPDSEVEQENATQETEDKKRG